MKVRTPFNPSKAALWLALACVLLAAPAARAQEPGARKPPTTGSLSGRVVGEGGEPLPDVVVQVRPRGVATSLAASRSTTTDAEGNFVAHGLGPGTYAVAALLQGYVSDPEPAGPAQPGHRLGDFVNVRMVRGGVITGTVTDTSNTPLVALNVAAYRVRDQEGRPAAASGGLGFPAQTDDRGVYRVYGLPPGVYLVAAASGPAWGPVSPYDGDAPTFYPSATRDTAAEVTVRAGQEVAGIDIRHREERGRRVTGTVKFPAQSSADASLNVSLSYAGTGVLAAATWVQTRETPAGFAFEGVADGDYDVQVQLNSREGLLGSSAPLRVSVRGADVTGLVLTPVTPAGVSGTLAVEPATEALRALPDCKERPLTLLLQETLFVARRDAGPGGAASASPVGRGPQQREAAPDETGAFAIRALEPGVYRFEVRTPDENFYARPVQRAGAAARPGAATAPAGPLNLAAGQQVSGLAVRLAPGAAGLAGRVAASDPAAPFAPAGLRLHLVPAERERADEPAHYAETGAAADGSFAFRNLAPGRYLLVARPLDAGEFPPRPLAWDAEARARLRREAEAAAQTIELQPCQRVTDFTLRYPHAPARK